MSVKNKLSPQEQLRIFLEGPKGNVKIAEICRREELWPKEYYQVKERINSPTPKKNRRFCTLGQSCQLRTKINELKPIITLIFVSILATLLNCIKTLSRTIR